MILHVKSSVPQLNNTHKSWPWGIPGASTPSGTKENDFVERTGPDKSLMGLGSPVSYDHRARQSNPENLPTTVQVPGWR